MHGAAYRLPCTPLPVHGAHISPLTFRWCFPRTHAWAQPLGRGAGRALGPPSLRGRRAELQAGASRASAHERVPRLGPAAGSAPLAPGCGPCEDWAVRRERAGAPPDSARGPPMAPPRRGRGDTAWGGGPRGSVQVSAARGGPWGLERG